MRQSGILAAAGLYALAHHRGAIVQDHERARRFALGVAETPGFRVDPPTTNIVFVDIDDGGELIELLSFLEFRGILVLEYGAKRLRAVTHRDVDDAGIARAIAGFGEWANYHGR